MCNDLNQIYVVQKILYKYELDKVNKKLHRNRKNSHIEFRPKKDSYKENIIHIYNDIKKD